MTSATHPELTELLAALVAIDSVNPDLVPGGAGETAIAEFVAGWLEEAGLETRIEEAAPGRPNVVAIARGSGGGRSLMLNAHLDTVGVAAMDDPFEPRIEDGRLHGRGALDTKAGLAAAMWAAARAQRDGGLGGDVIVTAVADEEAGSLGTEAIVKSYRAVGAIVLEPTGLHMVTAHSGFAWATITTIGRAAHGSRPELGVDAITAMGRILTGLDDLGRTLTSAPGHPEIGTGSIHAGRISGGQELSSYPERCVLDIERRLLPGETSATVRAELSDLVEQARAASHGATATISYGLHREPLQADPGSPIVRALSDAGRKVLGTALPLAGERGWTDAALLNAAGTPAVVFGPEGEGLHARIEWVDLASTSRCAEILLTTALDFCSRP